MKKQIPWKYLPIVLLLLFLPAVPAIFMRHETKQAAQAALVTEPELRQMMVDSFDDKLPRADAECVADVLIERHGTDALVKLYQDNNTDAIYTPEVKQRLLDHCGVTYQ